MLFRRQRLAGHAGAGAHAGYPANCFACATATAGPYCHVCGQKNDDCRRSVVRLAYEAVADSVAFDGRVWRTLASVSTRPGGHVRDYGHGRRSPYSPPVRLFLVVSFTFFMTLWATGTQIVSFRPQLTTDAAGVQDVGLDVQLLARVEAHPLTPEERAALREGLMGDESSTADEPRLEIGGKSLRGQELADHVFSLLENPAAFNAALNDWIPRVLIVLIPLLAVLGAMFIRGRGALIYDHLLLSLATHTMAFLILTLGLVVSSFVSGPIPGSIMGIGFLFGLPLYYLLGLKGAFGRGWIKTVFSTIVIWSLYALFLLIGLAIAASMSFADTI